MKKYTVVLVLPAYTTKEIALNKLRELQECPVIGECQISCEGLKFTPRPDDTYDFVVNETGIPADIDLPVIPIEVLKYMRPDLLITAIERITEAYKRISPIASYLPKGIGIEFAPQVGVDFFHSVAEGVEVTQGKRMNVTSLHQVILHKTDTCWTYALKRTGKFRYIAGKVVNTATGTEVDKLIYYEDGNTVISADHTSIEQYFDTIPFSEWESIADMDLYPGDLIMLSGNEIWQVLPDRINENGELEYTSQIIRRHVVVYEGNGMVSHAVLDHIDAMFKSITAMCIKIETLEAVLQGSAGSKAYLLHLK